MTRTPTAKKNRVNGRAKGAVGERRAAKFLCSLGFTAERMARNGLSKADLDCSKCATLSRVWLEVKHSRAIRLGTQALDNAFIQATLASDYRIGGLPPAVLWFEPSRGWRLTYCEFGIQVTTDTPERIKLALCRLAGVDELAPAGGGAEEK